MATKTTAKEIHEDFYDSDITPPKREHIPTGLKNKGIHYHLKATNTALLYWDDAQERPHLDISTEVASGEFEGQYGPRITLSVGGFIGQFVRTAAEDARLIREFVQRSGITPTFTNAVGTDLDGEPVGYDEQLLNDIAAVVEDAEFITLVREDKNGYLKAYKTPNNRKTDTVGYTFYSVMNPPAGFVGEAGLEDFKL